MWLKSSIGGSRRSRRFIWCALALFLCPYFPVISQLNAWILGSNLYRQKKTDVPSLTAACWSFQALMWLKSSIAGSRRSRRLICVQNLPEKNENQPKLLSFPVISQLNAWSLGPHLYRLKKLSSLGILCGRPYFPRKIESQDRKHIFQLLGLFRCFMISVLA